MMVVDARLKNWTKKGKITLGCLWLHYYSNNEQMNMLPKHYLFGGSFSYCGKNWNMSLIIVEYQWWL